MTFVIIVGRGGGHMVIADRRGLNDPPKKGRVNKSCILQSFMMWLFCMAFRAQRNQVRGII